MSNHRFVTYNILSSHLAEPEHFVKCDRADLDPETRLNRILAKLLPEIDQNSIICLQEVSTLWAGEFHRFFANRNYYLVTGLYGNQKNGYMGVAIAFPLEKYKLLETKIERLSDSRDWPKLSPLVMAARNLLQGFVRLWDKKKAKSLEHPITHAQRRTNQLIFLRLEDKAEGNKFGVATYHMPCVFYAPKVMTIHASMLVQRIQELAQDDPFVLTGDFNIRPAESHYQLITTGSMASNNPAYPPILKGDRWRPELATPLRSAYREAFGQEPEFTNYAQTRNKPPFQETLDYIWLSSQWQVVSALPLPTRDQVTSSFPNPEQPSDHILLAAEMTLKKLGSSI